MEVTDLTRLKVKDIVHTTQFFKDNSVTAYVKDLTFEAGGISVNDCGIYGFYDDQDNLLYVGQSKNLLSRVSHHLKYSVNPMHKIRRLIRCIRFLIIDREEYHQHTLMKVEEGFIQCMNPLFNGSGTRGLSNLRSFIDGCDNDTPVNVIKDKIAEFTEKSSGEKQTNENEGDFVHELKELFSVKEAIKLAIKHEDEEKADEIIDGLLQMVNKIGQAS